MILTIQENKIIKHNCSAVFYMSEKTKTWVNCTLQQKRVINGLKLPHELVHIKTTMKARSGQNYDNKMALNPTAANIMDLLHNYFCHQ